MRPCTSMLSIISRVARADSRVVELLRTRGLVGPDLTPAAVYATLRKNGLNTREKRLEFAQNGTDRRMARLAQALSGAQRVDRAPEGQGGEE